MQWEADINSQESWGQTPLAVATLKGHVQCMNTLLRLGADHSVKDHYYLQTALHVACASRDEESVLALLDADCSLHSVNRKGLSALGIAVSNRFYRGVPLLLEYGAQLNDADRGVVSKPLQEHIDQQTGVYTLFVCVGFDLCSSIHIGSPLSLLQLSRVAVRKCLGPTHINDLPSTGLPHHLVGYVRSILELCEGQLIRELSLDNSTKQE